MAFLRFTRDKRGYQHFYLVESITNRRGKVKERVLYWFRSPPDIRVGREPFDESARRALEARNPDVTFDWRAILETPIPSADAEKWRERRRAERAAKQAMAAASMDEPDVPDADAEAEDEESERVVKDAAGSGDNVSRKRHRRRGKRPSQTPSAAGPAESAESTVDAAKADDSNDPIEPSGE